jgi:hypothetical protein
MNNKKELSTLSKTWIFDLDGTLVEHNGYKSTERILPGTVEFFRNNIKDGDVVVLMTARSKNQVKSAIKILNKNNLRFDTIITDLPHGERILFNDKKSSGLITAHSFCIERNAGLSEINIVENKEI